jgi:pimeloyl-ACP methyl ester carboxylesterase
MVNPRFGPRVSVILPVLEIPILLLWGRQDRMVLLMFAPKFAAMNLRIQLVELDDAGHCPHDECAERVNGAIADWLCDQVQKQRTAAQLTLTRPLISSTT